MINFRYSRWFCKSVGHVSNLIRFHPHNVLGIRQFADTLGCSMLVEAAEKYIQQYFHDVSLSDEYLNLSSSELLDIVKRDELHVISEEQVSHTFIILNSNLLYILDAYIITTFIISFYILCLLFYICFYNFSFCSQCALVFYMVNVQIQW